MPYAGIGLSSAARPADHQQTDDRPKARSALAVQGTRPRKLQVAQAMHTASSASHGPLPVQHHKCKARSALLCPSAVCDYQYVAYSCVFGCLALCLKLLIRICFFECVCDYVSSCVFACLLFRKLRWCFCSSVCLISCVRLSVCLRVCLFVCLFVCLVVLVRLSVCACVASVSHTGVTR